MQSMYFVALCVTPWPLQTLAGGHIRVEASILYIKPCILLLSQISVLSYKLLVMYIFCSVRDNQTMLHSFKQKAFNISFQKSKGRGQSSSTAVERLPWYVADPGQAQVQSLVSPYGLPNLPGVTRVLLGVDHKPPQKTIMRRNSWTFYLPLLCCNKQLMFILSICAWYCDFRFFNLVVIICYKHSL